MKWFLLAAATTTFVFLTAILLIWHLYVGLFFFLTVFTIVIALLSVFLRALIVREGKAVSFEFLGKYVMTCFNLRGHMFDRNGFIIPGNGFNTFGKCWLIFRTGGLVFYAKYFVRPVPYREKSEDDGFGDGYSLHLNEMQEELELVNAETTEKDDNAIALDIDYVVKWRIANPYLYLYMAPKDAKKQMINKLHGVQRAWVKSGNETHAQSAKGNGVRSWEELVALGCQSIFDDAKADWGLEIMENSIIVTDVGYDEDYQKALKSKKEETLKAEGAKARIYGPVLGVLPQGSALTPEQAVQLRALDMGASVAMSDNKTTLDVQSGGQPINPNFAGGIAIAEVVGDALARAFGKKGPIRPSEKQGSPSNGGKKGDNTGRKNRDYKNLSPEEQKQIDEEWERQTGKKIS